MLNEKKKISELNEHPQLKDFYQIPRYPLLYINLKQEVLDSRYDMIMMAYVGYYDYLKVDIVGLMSGVLIHRAMAETFLDSGNLDPKKYQVNHKDGDKLNNDLDNLEFVTRSQNSVHAFKTGLRSDNRAVLCKDLRTGKVIRFYSMNECSRIIASNQGYLSNYLKGARNVPVMGIYEVIFEGDEWKGFPPELIKEHPNKTYIDIAAVSEDGKSVRVYRTIAAVAKDLNISTAKVTKALKDGSLVNGFTFMVLEDFIKKLPKVPYEKVPYPKTLRGRKPPRPIIVRDNITGEETRWISTERFANHHGVNKKSIQKSMNVKNGVWCNFTITYGK